MGTVYEAIDYIRNTATSERDKGTKYERLTRFFLKNDPLWKSKLSDVWMWENAPTNDGADIGIDLVGKDREDGTYWAIQCKCYDDDTTLDYQTVGTFFGKAGNQGLYPYTMIITTAARFSTHLETIAENWNTVRVFTDDMAESDIDYSAWIEGRETTTRTFKEPRPHQVEAIKDCLMGFREHDRGQLIMACGTGKTITALRLTEEYLTDIGKQGGRILFLAPSIALVGQSMREWANQSKLPMVCAVVCSDVKASNVDEDTWESSLKLEDRIFHFPVYKVRKAVSEARVAEAEEENREYERKRQALQKRYGYYCPGEDVTKGLALIEIKSYERALVQTVYSMMTDKTDKEIRDIIRAEIPQITDQEIDEYRKQVQS